MSVSLTLYPTQERAPLPNGCSLCCRRTSLFLGGRLPSSLGSLSAMPVEGLPIVLASGFIADPSLEIGPAAVGVIVLVILAVIPVALLVPLPIIWSLPLVVDMHVVVLLALVHFLWLFGIVLLAPLVGLGLGVSVGAILFAVFEVSIGVVVLPVFIPVMRPTLVGEARRSRKHHHCCQQPHKHHQPSQVFLLPKATC
jgi:hypothetical protein